MSVPFTWPRGPSFHCKCSLLSKKCPKFVKAAVRRLILLGVPDRKNGDSVGTFSRLSRAFIQICRARQSFKIVFIHLIAVFRFVLLSVVTQDAARILRLNCGSEAFFSVIQQNSRLLHQFMTLPFIDADTCRFECVRDPRCKSYNFNQIEGTCELNNRSSKDPTDDVLTETQHGWTYFSTLYNQTMVSNG